MSGWICSYRAIWDHALFEGCAWRVGVWDWMLKKAAFKPRQFRVGSAIIDLERGQLCVSQRQIETETGVGRTALRTFMDALESEKAITRGKTQGLTQGRTIITICKYDNYQVVEHSPNPRKNQVSTQDQPTNKQLNNLTITPVGEADASTPINVSVVTTALWSAGKQYLSSNNVANPGGLIGRWLKENSPVEILNAIETSQKSGTQDPVPYITEILKGGQNGKPASKSAQRIRAWTEGARGTFNAP